MGLSSGRDIRFDYDGSLSLARRLWSFAAELDDLQRNRRRSAEDALVGWLGRYGTEFGGRVSDEVADLAVTVEDLRAAAVQWGAAWAHAVNEQNRRTHAREVVRVKNSRSWVDSFTGFFTGHDDLPPDPSEVGAPQPPHFQPTGHLIHY